jgi:hypothetical protein
MPDCPASGQSGTGMNKNADAGTSLLQECSSAGLRYKMPECRFFYADVFTRSW